MADRLPVAAASSRIAAHEFTALSQAWHLAGTAAAQFLNPEQLSAACLQWSPAIVPGTVAMSLGADLDSVGHYDANDWWYRCRFSAPDARVLSRHRLRFEGLATLAEVWLNGRLVLASSNMFVTNTVDITELLQADNELTVCLRSLDQELSLRKPRPRWKTSLVSHQNLRWIRTTLLGRIPGWTPPINAVGVWKPVLLETASVLDVQELDLQVSAEGGAGRVRLRCDVKALGSVVTEARLCIADQLLTLDVVPEPEALSRVRGDLLVQQLALWWPHTHGTPALHTCRIELRVDGQWVVIECGRIGFKSVRLERGNGLVQLQVNGQAVFCRGACWTTDDFLALHADVAQLRRTLELARDAGLNMLRVGGTMTYESDTFYALCDELGIMVWQDFMFANMDYPVTDAAFRSEIENEVAQQLGRLQHHACVTTYCGNSEVEQQAAMLGLAVEVRSNEFFTNRLPELCARWHQGIPYFSSSPCEGPLPFHVGEGIAHYYGVGAYRRPLTDVKYAEVKFATECLGFSHVPEPETMELIGNGSVLPPHHPRWKARQPRDAGAGWDFEDIRDHYLQQIFGIDAVALRSQDLARYYALSRVVTGEVMQRVYAEWRAPRSVCGGALVWFFKDLWPGAGWGIVDSTGRPKAVYWYLKRAWAPRTVCVTDHGLDGLQIHVLNEAHEPLSGVLELLVYQHGRIRLTAAEQPVVVAARGTITLSGDAMLGRFFDTTQAYRFGTPQHDIVIARLRSGAGSVIAEDFHFAQGMNLPFQNPKEWTAQAKQCADGSVSLELFSEVILQSVHFDSDGYVPSDAYFHLAPRSSRQILFRPLDCNPRQFKAHVHALNTREILTVQAE